MGPAGRERATRGRPRPSRGALLLYALASAPITPGAAARPPANATTPGPQAPPLPSHAARHAAAGPRPPRRPPVAPDPARRPHVPPGGDPGGDRTSAVPSRRGAPRMPYYPVFDAARTCRDDPAGFPSHYLYDVPAFFFRSARDCCRAHFAATTGETDHCAKAARHAATDAAGAGAGGKKAAYRKYATPAGARAPAGAEEEKEEEEEEEEKKKKEKKKQGLTQHSVAWHADDGVGWWGAGPHDDDRLAGGHYPDESWRHSADAGWRHGWHDDDDDVGTRWRDDDDYWRPDAGGKPGGAGYDDDDDGWWRGARDAGAARGGDDDDDDDGGHGGKASKWVKGTKLTKVRGAPPGRAGTSSRDDGMEARLTGMRPRAGYRAATRPSDGATV